MTFKVFYINIISISLVLSNHAKAADSPSLQNKSICCGFSSDLINVMNQDHLNHLMETYILGLQFKEYFEKCKQTLALGETDLFLKQLSLQKLQTDYDFRHDPKAAMNDTQIIEGIFLTPVELMKFYQGKVQSLLKNLSQEEEFTKIKINDQFLSFIEGQIQSITDQVAHQIQEYSKGFKNISFDQFLNDLDDYLEPNKEDDFLVSVNQVELIRNYIFLLKVDRETLSITDGIKKIVSSIDMERFQKALLAWEKEGVIFSRAFQYLISSEETLKSLQK
jgi:hypothetical protein